MPSGNARNTLYALALPIIGKRCEWKNMEGTDDPALKRALKSSRVVGCCIQRIRAGKLAECYTAGYYSLEPERKPVTSGTIFRTASIAKFVTALLVFRLQTIGKIDVREDISDLAGYPIRSPYCPDAPITLGMLMSHSSGIVDGAAYARALSERIGLREILNSRDSYAPSIPGAVFAYSNLAAGMIGSLLESRFGESLEVIAQRELFEPLGISATFDISKLADKPVADSYRVLPPALAFNARKRIESAEPLDAPDPEHRYQHMAGNLYISAPELAKLAIAAWRGNDGFINDESLAILKSRRLLWPVEGVKLYHGMGALQISDNRICSKTVYGHQGIAYGAANGLMFTDDGDGFVVLNSGASERRIQHFTQLNKDLMALFLDGKGEKHDG